MKHKIIAAVVALLVVGAGAFVMLSKPDTTVSAQNTSVSSSPETTMELTAEPESSSTTFNNWIQNEKRFAAIQERYLAAKKGAIEVQGKKLYNDLFQVYSSEGSNKQFIISGDKRVYLATDSEISAIDKESLRLEGTMERVYFMQTPDYQSAVNGLETFDKLVDKSFKVEYDTRVKNSSGFSQSLKSEDSVHGGTTVVNGVLGSSFSNVSVSDSNTVLLDNFLTMLERHPGSHGFISDLNIDIQYEHPITTTTYTGKMNFIDITQEFFIQTKSDLSTGDRELVKATIDDKEVPLKLDYIGGTDMSEISIEEIRNFFQVDTDFHYENGKELVIFITDNKDIIKPQHILEVKGQGTTNPTPPLVSQETAPPVDVPTSTEMSAEDKASWDRRYQLFISMGLSPDEARTKATENLKETKEKWAEKERQDKIDAAEEAKKNAEELAVIDAEYLDKYGYTFNEFRRLSSEKQRELLRAYNKRWNKENGYS